MIDDDTITFMTALLVIFGMLVFWIFQSHVEMKTFNKFSERKVTLSEAMFSNLRIEACGNGR